MLAISLGMAVAMSGIGLLAIAGAALILLIGITLFSLTILQKKQVVGHADAQLRHFSAHRK